MEDALINLDEVLAIVSVDPEVAAQIAESRSEVEAVRVFEAAEKAVKQTKTVKVPKAVGRPRKFATRDLRTASFQLPTALHTRFKTYCSLRGVEMSTIIREKIEEFLDLRPNTEDQVAFEKLQDWFVEYKQTPGATLGQVLEKLREMQVVDKQKEVR